MITVEEVINSLLDEQEDYTSSKFVRYFSLAQSGLRNLLMDLGGGQKPILLDFNRSTLTVDLPRDYVSYKLIAIVDDKGLIKPLSKRNDIPVLDRGKIVRDDNELFGSKIDINQDGNFTEDIIGRRLIFDQDIGVDQLYIEYVSSGKPDPKMPIHPFLVEPLQAWIYWKSIARKKGSTRGERLDAKSEFFRTKRHARSQFKSFTKEEALRSIRRGVKFNLRY
jgi:hypothetical protein